MEKTAIDIDEIINNAQLEETETAKYYFACVANLHLWLQKNTNIGDPDTRQRIQTLFLWWTESEPETAEPTPEYVKELMIDLLLYGMIGKAFYFLRGRNSGQFTTEALRLLQTGDISQMRGNTWLFHTAGRLAQGSFTIRFIPERDGKTPDYTATRGNIAFHVEANARSQVYRDIRNIRDLIWKVLHDGDKGKAVKFTLPEFDPGIIAVDVSHCDVHANETGLPPYMKLKLKAHVIHRPGFYVYDTTKDLAFFDQLMNTGNIVEYSIRFFQRLDKKKYFVRGLLIGTSMRVVEQGDSFSSPKGGFLVLDHRYSQLALQELAPAVYLVDAEPANIPELGT